MAAAPASYLLFYLLSLIDGLTDGKLICASARRQLRNTEGEKGFRKIKFMNGNADIIAQLPAELLRVREETVSLGCEITSHFIKEIKQKRPLLRPREGGGEKERERKAVRTAFSLNQK